MTPNPILEELYAARDKLLVDAGGDVHKYLQGVREREAASGCLLKPAQQDQGCICQEAQDQPVAVGPAARSE